jgi:hypothetical protein
VTYQSLLRLLNVLTPHACQFNMFLDVDVLDGNVDVLDGNIKNLVLPQEKVIFLELLAYCT